MAFLMHSSQNTWPQFVVTSLRPVLSNSEARSIHTGHVMEDLPADLVGVELKEVEGLVVRESEGVVGREVCFRLRPGVEG